MVIGIAYTFSFTEAEIWELDMHRFFFWAKAVETIGKWANAKKGSTG